MNETTSFSRNEAISELFKIGHGDLRIYKNALNIVNWDPEFFAHLLAWNHKNGQIRDSKIAYPLIALRGSKNVQFYENAAAHLCLLDTKDMLKAYRHHRILPKTNGGGVWFKTAVVKYIKHRERNRRAWENVAVQHRKSLKALYALNHIKPNAYANRILFKNDYPAGSVFEKIAQLNTMAPREAAVAIISHRIPFLIAAPALGKMDEKDDVIMAIMEQMTLSELVTNTNMLKKLGVFQSSVLEATYNQAIERGKKSKRVAPLKAGIAAKKIGDKKIAKKLEAVQEDQLQKSGSIDGDWLVIGDCSSSMRESIEVAKNVAALLCNRIKGKVYLIFANDRPRFFDVSGKTLKEIQDETGGVGAYGTTALGCALDYILKKKIVVNGIAMCSDGGDWVNPMFHNVYPKYAEQMGVEPTVYLFHVPGDPDRLSKACGLNRINVEKFELTSTVDYYALPNLIMTMHSNQYSLSDEIFETPLLTFADVFAKKER